MRHLGHAVRGLSPNTRNYLAGTCLMGLGLGAMAVHLNLYLRSIGVGEADIGNILSAASVGTVAVSLPAAMWVDRFRAERIFVLAASGYAACCLLMLFFPHPALLLANSFLTGTLFTVHWVAAAPFFMRNAAPGRRTELFGMASALETLAIAVSAYGAGLLAHGLGTALGSESGGLRWSLASSAVLSLAAVVPFARIRSAPARTVPRGWREYVFSREMPLILRLSLPTFLIGCGAGLTIPFLNLYFRDRFHQDPARIGIFFAVAQVLTMAGFLLGPVMARRFGHVRSVIATELLSIPFFLVLAVANQLWIAVAAFWMRGALMNMNQPVSQAFAMEIVSEDQRTVTNSVRTFAWNLSWMVSTAAGGRLIEAHGYSPGMFATMGLYLAAASLFWIFFRGRTVGG